MVFYTGKISTILIIIFLTVSIYALSYTPMHVVNVK